MPHSHSYDQTNRVLLAGGPDLEEEEMDGFSLQVLEEDEETGISSSEEEDGPGPPSRMYFSFVFLWCFLVILGELKGRRITGTPHYNCASWFEVGKGYTIEKPAVAP